MKNTILVIEDNEKNLYMTTYILEKHGYKIIQAENGYKGIGLAISDKPTLIILDIQLPLMDGYEVAQRLKKQVETKKIPIVAVTSYAMLGDRDRILESGCTGYIEKPINPCTFVSQIEQHLPPES